MEVFAGFYDEQNYILSNGLKSFEDDFAKYCDCKYGIGVANGHDALLIILKALGIGSGDEVILPAHTFIATALSIKNAGAVPVLADIDSQTFNIDPNSVESKITPKTRAIVPVHLYGNPCDMESISRIAENYNLHLIEDNAQSQGAEYQTQKTGSFGIMNFTSFYPTKNIGALGDGGMITTNSFEYAEKARQIRNYGKSSANEYSENGLNSRLDELQARILSVKLKYLDGWNNERNKIAKSYRKSLANVNQIQLPIETDESFCTYHIYPVLSRKRDHLRDHLRSRGIDTLIHYDKPIHLQPSFAYLGEVDARLPVAETICSRELSLPIYPGLTKEDVQLVCDEIKDFYNNS